MTWLTMRQLEPELDLSNKHQELCTLATHPPCDSLNRFFLRSMILSAPAGVISPMSPVWKKPSSSAWQGGWAGGHREDVGVCELGRLWGGVNAPFQLLFLHWFFRVFCFLKLNPEARVRHTGTSTGV